MCADASHTQRFGHSDLCDLILSTGWGATLQRFLFLASAAGVFLVFLQKKLNIYTLVGITVSGAALCVIGHHWDIHWLFVIGVGLLLPIGLLVFALVLFWLVTIVMRLIKVE
jgi:hypothetical protein